VALSLRHLDSCHCWRQPQHWSGELELCQLPATGTGPAIVCRASAIKLHEHDYIGRMICKPIPGFSEHTSNLKLDLVDSQQWHHGDFQPTSFLVDRRVWLQPSLAPHCRLPQGTDIRHAATPARAALSQTNPQTDFRQIICRYITVHVPIISTKNKGWSVHHNNPNRNPKP